MSIDLLDPFYMMDPFALASAFSLLEGIQAKGLLGFFDWDIEIYKRASMQVAEEQKCTLGSLLYSCCEYLSALHRSLIDCSLNESERGEWANSFLTFLKL